MYAKLMDLPDLPLEVRAQIEQEAHQWMVDGTVLLSEGLDDYATRLEVVTFPKRTLHASDGIRHSA